MKADLIILDGSVLTMDDEAPRAEAVAVANGKIVAVGSNVEYIGKFEKGYHSPCSLSLGWWRVRIGTSTPVRSTKNQWNLCGRHRNHW